MKGLILLAISLAGGDGGVAKSFARLGDGDLTRVLRGDDGCNRLRGDAARLTVAVLHCGIQNSSCSGLS